MKHLKTLTIHKQILNVYWNEEKNTVEVKTDNGKHFWFSQLDEKCDPLKEVKAAYHLTRHYFEIHSNQHPSVTLRNKSVFVRYTILRPLGFIIGIPLLVLICGSLLILAILGWLAAGMLLLAEHTVPVIASKSGNILRYILTPYWFKKFGTLLK